MIRMSAPDVRSSYRGSYLGWRTPSGTVPVYVVDVAESSTMDDPKIRIQKSSTGRKSTVGLNSENLVLEYPDLGNVMLDAVPYYLQRIAKRQWIRGIRTDTVHMFACKPERRAAVRTVNWWDVIKFVYKPQYGYDADNPCVLDANLCINHTPIPALYFRGMPVGEVLDTGIEVFNECSFLLQYIQEVINGRTSVVLRTS